jgi:valyl-tRNA synthetase
MLDKTYRPSEVEQPLYDAWEKAGDFSCRPDSNKAPYCIVIPPPNVTGSLHIGHALNNTLQDILIRWQRMKGRDALWQPGTDHAGIATQMVVERQLADKGVRRQDLGREAFVKRIWEWKEESGGTITRQLRRLGASCDWSRERFTMDDGLSAAVVKVFVDLYREGLIYKDKRLVNWDCKLETAISDLEVEAREIKGNLWHFKYPIEGEAERFIVVATTRPETMLGDTGVAVHPDDPRWKDLIGKHAILPLVGRRIPIVADEYSDPEKGTGAVKITPAHDFNDFEVGKRHKLEMIGVLDARGKINANAPESYRGLDRAEARKRVVADMEAAGLIDKIEPHVHTVPHGDRSGTPIEPYLTDQWYVDAATLAKPAIEAVEQGKTVFVPKQWENTYYAWMRNIQPWCISRQLWWGHQIPAWYGPDGKVFVAASESEAAAEAARHYGEAVALARDPDVLDTWFSSALWPFSTLGWPEKTKELARYYPNDTLVTGFDIIFFWVARMMMFGIHFMKDVPFRKVYVHALVRDERGQKMSKSKGNVIDPLSIVDKYGADALRFTLTALAAQGRDVKLSENRIEGYRNFVTKIWNAARFCEMNGIGAAALPSSFDPRYAKLTVNRWILGELARAGAEANAALEAYRFNDAALALYHFVWGTFCDWYLEFVKPLLSGKDDIAKTETRSVAATVLRDTLRLLHPLVPFVTEELWSKLGFRGKGFISGEPWPDSSFADTDAAAEMSWVVRLIEGVRGARSEMNVPAASKISLRLRGASAEAKARLGAHQEEILRLARLESAAVDDRVPAKGDVQVVLEDATALLPLAGIVDVAKEETRLRKELDKTESEIGKIDAKLSNQAFVAKAPEEVIEEQKERRAAAEAARLKLKDALFRLAS